MLVASVVPVNSLGTDGNTVTYIGVCGEVPVAAVVPFCLARHTGTTPALLRDLYNCGFDFLWQLLVAQRGLD